MSFSKLTKVHPGHITFACDIIKRQREEIAKLKEQLNALSN